MKNSDSFAGLFLEPAADIEASARTLGDAVQLLIAQRDLQAKDVYTTGGSASAQAFDAIADRARIIGEVVAVLVAAGLGDVLAAAQGDLQPAREPLTTTWSRRIAHDRFTTRRRSA